MQTTANTTKMKRISLSSIAAATAGVLYSCRWIWEWSEGIVKNKSYPPNFVTQNFFFIKVLFIIALAGVLQKNSNKPKIRITLLMCVLGLAWTAVTRTLEAYGAKGPWGFYSTPGVILFFTGLIATAKALMKDHPYNGVDKILLAIASFYLLGSLSSMVLFNILGRDATANQIGSAVANVFLIVEGFSWIYLARKL